MKSKITGLITVLFLISCVSAFALGEQDSARIKGVDIPIPAIIRKTPPVIEQEFSIRNTEDWTEVLSSIAEGGNNKSYTLIINGNIAIPGDLGVREQADINTFGHVSSLTVTLKGSGKLYLSSTGHMFSLSSGQTLIIDSENLTLQGLKKGQNRSKEDNNDSIIFTSGILELHNGKISDNSNGYDGGAINVSGGSFTMTGGIISGNAAEKGGGVYAVGFQLFTMTGGTISGNAAEKGGGVYVGDSFSFNMTGGTISGNTAEKGGGVYIDNVVHLEFFEKTGGIIYGNNAARNDKNTASSNQGGHAVIYFPKDGDGYHYYCDTTLDSKDTITINGVFPTRNGKTVNNWTRAKSR